jgi:hypothetical protein
MAATNFDGRRENRGGKPTTDKPSHHRCHTPPYWKKKHLEDFNNTTKESFWSLRDAAHAAIRTCTPLMYQLFFI